MLVPATFLLRAVIAGSFSLVSDPREFRAFFSGVMLIVISVIQFISVEVLFLRDMKKEIRGTLSGIGFFFGSFGTTVFALAGGLVFDKMGPWAPFAIVSCADSMVLLVSLFFILTLRREDWR